MEFVSLPRSSLGSRWRPVASAPMGAAAAPAWRPAHARMISGPTPASMGQIHPLAVADIGLSTAMSLGATLTGFGMAIWGPKDSTTWRWIGGLVGSIGVLRLLHDVSKW